MSNNAYTNYSAKPTIISIMGTVSLLAGIDLQTGEATPLVRDSHNSADFIDFLKIIDARYPSCGGQ